MNKQQVKKHSKFIRNFWIITASTLVLLGGIWLFAVYTVQNSINNMFYNNTIYIDRYSYTIDQQSNRMFTIELKVANTSGNQVDLKVTSGMIRLEQGYEYELMRSNSWDCTINATQAHVLIGDFSMSSSDFFALYNLGRPIYMEITIELTVHSKFLWAEKTETRHYNTETLLIDFRDLIMNPSSANSSTS